MPTFASSLKASSFCTVKAGPTPSPATLLTESGMPGGVSRAGGSMVRTDTRLNERLRPVVAPLESGVNEVATEMASMASATASSSGDGSKRRLEPTETTRSVIGGWKDGMEADFVEYTGKAASQSSLKNGSSSPSDTSAGRRVDSKAK